jgi:L-iditol 2-dehydrogenase
MMRASFLYGVRDVRIEKVAYPSPDPGDALLKVAAVGVCGSDVHYYKEGQIGPQAPEGPISMGHEFSARVAALGAGVTGLTVGQLVAVEPAVSCGQCEFCLHGHPNLCPEVKFPGTPPIDGVLRDFTVMPAENCFPVPPTMDAAEAALLEPLGVAIHAVNLAHIDPGESVAILGAGPIGLLTAAVAKASGANPIYMTEPLAYRRQFALDYAADAVFNPQGTDVVSAVLDLTGGRGVDVAFEAAGAEETPAQAAEVARPGGRVIVEGIPSDDRMIMRASTVRRKGLTIKLVRRMKHTYPRAIDLAQRGVVDLSSLITHRFPLEATSEAFELVTAYADGVIKAVIDVNP